VTFYYFLSFTKEKSWRRIGSVSQRYASVDPDPYQNAADRNNGPNNGLNEVKCTIYGRYPNFQRIALPDKIGINVVEQALMSKRIVFDYRILI
jgi:hypothetical protein